MTLLAELLRWLNLVFGNLLFFHTRFYWLNEPLKHRQGGSCFQYQQGTSTGPETTSNRKPALKKCKYTIFTYFFMGKVYSCRLVSVQKVLVSVDETLKLSSKQRANCSLSLIIQYNDTNITSKDVTSKYNDVFFSIYIISYVGYIRLFIPHEWKKSVQ